MRRIVQNNWSKLVAVALVLNLSITSCSFYEEDLKPSVSGEGVIKTESREVEAFSEIELETNATVYVTEGAETKVQVSAFGNLQPFVQTIVNGKTLIIDNKRSFRSEDQITIYITVPSVEKLTVRGAGKVISQGVLGTDHLALKVTGSGEIKVAADAETIKSDVDGSGTIEVAGHAYSQEVNISGSGKLLSYELLTEASQVQIGGSGNAFAQVAKKLDVKITGSGEVKYKGQPTVDTNITGTGRVSQLI
ncbi:head GIN domain-containing protein [Adhaeribacter aquaticus]|uniref:head GIN domain-containing protein n=1 Tax=Adhaeribacter aquaticus TaxID=299567 RepID=UPI00047AB4D6|nr:head GIN domain-containing protein [Adhaeribacter aquaticus]